MVEIGTGTNLIGKLVQFHTYDSGDWHRSREKELLTLGGVYEVVDVDKYGHPSTDVYTVKGDCKDEQALLYLHQFSVVGDTNAN